MSQRSHLALNFWVCIVLAWGAAGLGQSLSGRVYEGSTGTEPPPLGDAKPLPGVTVSLYGSNDSDDDGTGNLPIQTTTTNADGWYSLTARGAYDFYNIIQTNLATHVDSTPSPAATGVGGTVKSSNWIQYRYEDIFVTPVTTTGNKFWDKPIASGNHPPVAVDDSVTIPGLGAIYVLDNDSDPDGDGISISSTTDPPHGEILLIYYGGHGGIVYQSDVGFTGIDTFEYTISDGKGGTDTATVTITVQAPSPDAGTLNGYKRDADAGAGLAGWKIYVDVNLNGQWDSGEPNDVTDSMGYYEIPNLQEGTYRVCEVMQAGWEPVGGGTVCVEGVTIVAGTITTQDFHNRSTTAGSGSVVIVKEAVPQDDTGFLFCVDYAPGGFFDTLCQALRDPSDNQWSLSNLDLLETVTETVTEGWTLTDITITGDMDSGSAIDLASATVEVDFDQGEDIVIVFKNEKTGAGRYDHGDAPSSYGDASHDVGDYRLGQAVDAESGSLSSLGADGDDLDQTDDEDGVTLLSDLVVGQMAEVEIELTADKFGPLQSGSIDDCHPAIWIDYDRDGSFQDPAERIAASADSYVTAPKSRIIRRLFQVPASATPGITFMRVRAYQGILPYGVCPLGPTGHSGEGEVEDYQVEIKTEGTPAPAGGNVHGHKFNDLNGNRLWDAGEPALPGWTLWLDLNQSGVEDVGDMYTQTDKYGYFEFGGLTVGQPTTVGEVQQIGWTQTCPSGSGTYTLVVPAHTSSTSILFGNRQSGGPTADGEICGSKWNDLNSNTVPDADEPPVAGCTIYLDLNQNGRHDTGEPSQLTDATGSFTFTGLAIGSYTVAEEVPPGWQRTWPADPGTHVIQIQPTAQPACVMFGNHQVGSLGQEYDWGDAPDPTYPTLRASNGAYHTIVPGFFLGGSVDADVDGQETPDARGDDYDGTDDEDGVVFVTPLMPGQTAAVEVVASAPGYLDAWIDFNADGDWSQSSDQILTSEPLVAGVNLIGFQVPSGSAVDIDTYARLRLSSVGALPPGGPAQDGEVEDYHVLLGPEGPAIPGETEQPHVKWSQPPLEIDPKVDPHAPAVFCGWDEAARSTQSSGNKRQWRMDADDFRCLGPLPITRLRWWGGYKGWTSTEPPENQPVAWHIGFWANQVQGLGPDEPYLERLVWAVEIPNERIGREPVGHSEFPERFPETCFVYEVRLEPEEWFHQAEFASHDKVFWISITAIYPADAEPVNQWGWLTRPHVWRDGAVMPAIMGEWPTYDERLFPGRIYPVDNPAPWGQGQGCDLCFELLTEQPWSKWDQPFIGLREWPHYQDERSGGTSLRGEEEISRLVADDWVCERNTPVVAAAWWGSYIGYDYQACRGETEVRPPRPDYFLLQLRADEADAPGDIVWEYRAYEYDQILVGFDRDPDGEPNEPVFRYSVALPEESWFHQDAPGGHYWFSVAAVYADPLPQIVHPWGWTDHVHSFEAGALAIDCAEPAPAPWRALRDPQDRPVDMSFGLFTAP